MRKGGSTFMPPPTFRHYELQGSVIARNIRITERLRERIGNSNLLLEWRYFNRTKILTYILGSTTWHISVQVCLCCRKMLSSSSSLAKNEARLMTFKIADGLDFPYTRKRHRK